MLVRPNPRLNTTPQNYLNCYTCTIYLNFFNPYDNIFKQVPLHLFPTSVIVLHHKTGFSFPTPLFRQPLANNRSLFSFEYTYFLWFWNNWLPTNYTMIVNLTDSIHFLPGNPITRTRFWWKCFKYIRYLILKVDNWW